VELNSTGGPDYQGLAEDCHPILRPIWAQNMHRAAKRTDNFFSERRKGSNKITLFATINDTLIRRYGPDSVFEIPEKPTEPDFEKKQKQLCDPG
jgi:hypothetical protein